MCSPIAYVCNPTEHITPSGILFIDWKAAWFPIQFWVAITECVKLKDHRIAHILDCRTQMSLYNHIWAHRHSAFTKYYVSRAKYLVTLASRLVGRQDAFTIRAPSVRIVGQIPGSPFTRTYRTALLRVAASTPLIPFLFIVGFQEFVGVLFSEHGCVFKYRPKGVSRGADFYRCCSEGIRTNCLWFWCIPTHLYGIRKRCHGCISLQCISDVSLSLVVICLTHCQIWLELVVIILTRCQIWLVLVVVCLAWCQIWLVLKVVCF